MIRTELTNRARLFKAAELARVCGGRVVRSGSVASGVTTDTRDVQVGDCFVALPGDRFDGHDYVEAALAAGAVGLVVSKPIPRAAMLGDAFVIRVRDTFEALQQMAAHHRRQSSARVVGITGSCGKTSTKDMLAHVLSGTMRTVRSPKSFNNRIGVPLTLFQVQPDTQAAIVEVGSSEPGEIEKLTGVVAPDIAIVTCVAEAHLEGLGCVGGVAREKSRLVAGLNREGVAILNGDDVACREMAGATEGRTVMVRMNQPADWFATDAQFHGMGTTFLLQGERPVTLPVLGTHNVYNALFTIAAAVELGMEVDAVLEALCCLPRTSRRLEPKVVGDITIFDDTYNMNPASARAGLCALTGLQTAGRKVVVFGGMLELGSRAAELHRSLGEEVQASGVDILMTVGEDARGIAEGARAAGMKKKQVVAVDHAREAEDLLVEILGAKDMVLCKASRRFELDRLVDGLESRLGGVAKAKARRGKRSVK